MKLSFYKYASTPDRVDKTNFLSTVGTIDNVILKDDTDLMHPTFILKTNGVAYNSNYVYCSFTKRYYYITNITAMTGMRIAIECKIDVLHTYRNEILNSSAWVKKSEKTTNENNYKMLHNDIPFRQDYDTLGVDFINGDNVFPGSSGDTEPSVRNNILLIIK